MQFNFRQSHCFCFWVDFLDKAYLFSIPYWLTALRTNPSSTMNLVLYFLSYCASNIVSFCIFTVTPFLLQFTCYLFTPATGQLSGLFSSFPYLDSHSFCFYGAFLPCFLLILSWLFVPLSLLQDRILVQIAPAKALTCYQLSLSTH